MRVGEARASRAGDQTGRILSLVALAVFLWAGWRFVTADVDRLLQLVPDDAFYYLQIARNLVRLGHLTADGVSRTNGFHPAWMSISVALASWFQESASLLRAALCVSLMMHLAGAMLVGSRVRALANARWGQIAAVCWLLNPLTFLLALQTVEATTYVCALLILLGLHQALDARLREEGRGAPLRLAGLYGIGLAFVYLARTEGAVIVAMAVPWLLVRAARAYRRPGATCAVVAATCAGLAAVVLPWFVFSWWEVGTLAQDSGAMKMLWARDMNPSLFDKLRNLRYTIDFFFVRGMRLATLERLPSGAIWPLYGALGFLVALVLCQRDATPRRRALCWSIAPLLAVTVIYGMALTERQVWWLVVPCLSVFLTSFIVIPAAIERSPSRAGTTTVIQAALALSSLVLFLHWMMNGVPLYPWQPDVRTSHAAIERIVPAGERIGCFNSGIPLFFGTGRIVALDGIVSHDAKQAWQARELDTFITSRDVHYIADEQRALNQAFRFMRRRPVLTRVAAYPLRGWPTGERLLWRVSEPLPAASVAPR